MYSVFAPGYLDESSYGSASSYDNGAYETPSAAVNSYGGGETGYVAPAQQQQQIYGRYRRDAAATYSNGGDTNQYE